MTTLATRIVEAAARARAKEDGKPDWNALMDHDQARYLQEVRTALTAAHALAEAEGVVFAKVPDEMAPIINKNVMSSALQTERAMGHNEAIRKTHAGRVTL